MSKEQAIEIAKLVYPWTEPETEFDFHYQPYDESWYRDAREYVRVNFKGIVFADKVYPLKMEIDVQLNVWFMYEKKKIGDVGYMDSLPTRNQKKIQDKFREWGIEPKEYK